MPKHLMFVRYAWEPFNSYRISLPFLIKVDYQFLCLGLSLKTGNRQRVYYFNYRNDFPQIKSNVLALRFYERARWEMSIWERGYNKISSRHCYFCLWYEDSSNKFHKCQDVSLKKNPKYPLTREYDTFPFLPPLLGSSVISHWDYSPIHLDTWLMYSLASGNWVFILDSFNFPVLVCFVTVSRLSTLWNWVGINIPESHSKWKLQEPFSCTRR